MVPEMTTLLHDADGDAGHELVRVEASTVDQMLANFGVLIKGDLAD